MDIFDILLLIVSIILIVLVLLQSSKDDINDAFNGICNADYFAHLG